MPRKSIKTQTFTVTNHNTNIKILTFPISYYLDTACVHASTKITFKEHIISSERVVYESKPLFVEQKRVST